MVAKKANPLPPWASVNIEPKRKFKFQLAFGDVPAWVVKTAARPSMAIPMPLPLAALRDPVLE